MLSLGWQTAAAAAVKKVWKSDEENFTVMFYVKFMEEVEEGCRKINKENVKDYRRELVFLNKQSCRWEIHQNDTLCYSCLCKFSQI